MEQSNQYGTKQLSPIDELNGTFAVYLEFGDHSAALEAASVSPNKLAELTDAVVHVPEIA